MSLNGTGFVRRGGMGLGMLWVLTLGCFLSGCNIVGPAAYVLEGPATIDPVYVLPKVKIVVFLDDRGSVIPRTRLRRIVAANATKQLLQVKRMVPAAVDGDAAVRVAEAESSGDLLSIDEIGRRVGADIIIYVQPQSFGLMSGGMPRPSADLLVKVIDCQTGERLFPAGFTSNAHMVTATMAIKPGSHFENADTVRQLEEDLADFAGLRLAQVFFEHELNPLDAERSR